MSQLIPSPHIRDAALIADHNNLRSAFDGAAVIAARGTSTPRACLREDDLPDAVRAADAVAHPRDHASGRRRPLLPSVKLGKSLRFREEDVNLFIQDLVEKRAACIEL